MAIYFGLVPALIYCDFTNTDIYSKRDLAIDKWIDENLVTDESVRRLLTTFISGDKIDVPPLLLPLMNTVKDSKVRWIPCHMMEVLRKISSRLPLELGTSVNYFDFLFKKFMTSDEKSGKAWECLFVIALLIRALAKKPDDVLLKCDRSRDYSVSINSPLTEDEDFSAIKTVDELLANITLPDHLPHIAIYFPSHASFTPYDVILCKFSKIGKKLFYGYQLNEGSASADKQVRV
jgi:hypothetical protein